MKLRLLKYIKSPLGVFHRLKRDIPYWIRGTTFYANAKKYRQDTSIKHTSPKYEINQYIDYRTTRKANGVIYTCITNDYDDLSLIANPPYINPDWDYICYTDNSEDCEIGQIGIWEIRPLYNKKFDATRQNRWHKLHPHILFPEYNESIYIDANVLILSSFLFDELKTKNSNIVIPLHPQRSCIYDEYSNIFAEFMDNPTLIYEELKLVKRSGMPKNFGLTENNLIYRRHHNHEIIELMSEWWFIVTHFAKRDQLSLCWLLWQHDIKISDISIPHAITASGRYTVLPHKKRIRLH